MVCKIGWAGVGWGGGTCPLPQPAEEMWEIGVKCRWTSV